MASSTPPADPSHYSGAEIVGTDVFLLSGLVELVYGLLSFVPAVFPAPSLSAVGANGTTGVGTPSSSAVVDPLSGDTLIPVPVPTVTTTPSTSSSASQPHSVFPFYPSPHTASSSTTSSPVAYPWILRIPSRGIDLLALSAACFGGIPSIIFWARGVGRGGGEDRSARDYAVGALIYHIAVPVVSIFKLLRTGPLSHPASSTSPASSITPTTTSTAASAAQGIAQTAVAAAEMAATAATSAAGRNYEASVASGIMHIGLAVGFARWLLRSYSRKPATRPDDRLPPATSTADETSEVGPAA